MLEKTNLKRQSSVEKAKLGIVTLKRRDEDLDVLFKRIYEDLVTGRLSPERFDKLSTQYEEEQEQKQVQQQVIGELQSLINDGDQEAHNLRQFLKSVRKYTDPEELTAEMLINWLTKSLFTLLTGAVDIADRRLRFTARPLELSTSLTTSVKPGTAEVSGIKSKKRPKKSGL